MHHRILLILKIGKRATCSTRNRGYKEVSAIEGVDEATDRPEVVQDEANAEEAFKASQTEQPAEDPKAGAQAPVTNVVPEQTQQKPQNQHQSLMMLRQRR